MTVEIVKTLVTVSYALGFIGVVFLSIMGAML